MKANHKNYLSFTKPEIDKKPERSRRLHLLQERYKFLAVECFTLDNLWTDDRRNHCFQLVPLSYIHRIEFTILHVTELCALEMGLYKRSSELLNHYDSFLMHTFTKT